MKLLSLNTVFLVSVCGLFFGCSSTENTTASVSEGNVSTQSKAEELGLKCQMTKSTGTHMKRKNCTTLAQREREEAEGQKFIRSVKSGMAESN
ncbi:hypothetical protein [Shewanella sp. SR44-3]|uniref:hypothetical protein n=1 Tax=unclassified Shewanella TaxID=196818 RepID=UPI0015FD99BD|nr:hypothetical protein [Shewanella sp. SR44-3]MBB1270135.1 hypothetical protein [Shewanella sp. SR44-3]